MPKWMCRGMGEATVTGATMRKGAVAYSMQIAKLCGVESATIGDPELRSWHAPTGCATFAVPIKRRYGVVVRTLILDIQAHDPKGWRVASALPGVLFLHVPFMDDMRPHHAMMLA